MRVYVFIIFLFLACLSAKAQTPLLDSLKNELILEHADTLKLFLYSAVVKQSQYGSSDSMRVYIEKGEALASKINDNKWIAHFNHSKALYLEKTASREETVIQYLKTKELYEKIHDTINIVKIHAALVSRYSALGKMSQALSHYEKGMTLLPKDNLLMRASLNNRLGIVYGTQGKMEVALRYFQFNLPIYKELKDNYSLGFTNMNIGIIYDEIGIHLDSAKFHLEEGLRFHRLAEKPQALAGNLGELSSFYINRKEYERALPYALEAIDIMEPLNSPFYISSLYSKVAEIYRNLGHHFKAIKAAQKGIKCSEETQDYNTMKELLGILASSSFSTAQYKEAYLYENRRIAIRDTLFSIDNQRITEEMEQKYVSKEKQAQINFQESKLSRQRFFIIGIGIISLLLLALVFMSFRVSTHRKKRNQQLHQLNQTKSRFFTNISHELRTPLTLIIAPIENAILKVKSKSAKEDLKLAHSNSKKLLSLVNEVLDLSKLESGKMTIHESPVSLEKLLRRIFFSYHSLAQLRGFILSFSYHLPEDLVIKLDIDKFEKVLNNLLSNAFKYSQTGGVITLRAGKENRNLRIEVSDTGKGLPPEQLEKIFERFYQVEGENQPLQGGTGIGLAYAKEIARLFGGNLYVESEVEKGSTFIFIIPLKKGTLKNNLVEEKIVDNTIEGIKTPPFLLTQDKAHILVVEDNPEMSRFLVQTLSPHFHCSTALDGEKALQILAKPEGENIQKPDLITSDVMMPNMDGFTFLQKVRELKTHVKTPVIMLTARALEEDKLRGFALGVDDYLTKPFSNKELIARIHNLLRTKKIRDTLPEEDVDEKIPNSEYLNPSKKTLSHQEQLVKDAEAFVIQHLDNGDYKVSDLARDLTYSPRQLERLLKKSTGFSPVEFIREIRLQKAFKLLKERRFATIAEVRYEVGMENASYFAKKIRERFGVNPKDV